MNKRSMIRLNLEFSGAVLPVGTNDQGQKVVPLKPIVDVIGLDWETQRKKVNNVYLCKRLGTCTVPSLGAGQQREMVCIRLDRVAAFLNTINPENVRTQGNDSSADWLERKQTEWDDLLDAYERDFGSLIQKVKSPNVRDLLSVLRARKAAESEPERQFLTTLAQRIAADLGAPFPTEEERA